MRSTELALSLVALRRAVFATLLGALWASLFWFQPARQWPISGDVSRFVDATLRALFDVSGTWRWAIKSYLFVGVPLVVAWACGMPPRALGLGKVATHGWRIVASGFLVSLPVLVWLGRRPGIYRYYERMFTADGGSPLLANALVIIVEHAFIEGLLLTLALPRGYRLEDRGEEAPRRGRLSWLGFGNTPGGSGIFDWLGIPLVVWPALVGQSLIFGMVHAGKEVGELVTAFPGGLGLGLLTWRIRSVWPSVLLHLGTGFVILATAWLTFGRPAA